MTARPPLFPSWCTSNPNGIAVPSSAQQGAGFVPSEPPAAEHCNWLANTTSQWLQYLDEQGSSTILASSLDYSTRLIGGGQWSYTGTTLAWSAAAFIAVPSAADANNTIAAGSVSIPSGSVAYVTANMPFSTQATTTSGSAQLTDVLYGDMATVGQVVTGAGIPANTTVQAVGADGQSVTLSANATASASNVSVTFSSSGTLSVSVAASATFVPGPNTVIFARAVGNGIIVGVGSGQMFLRRGEFKELLGSGFALSTPFTAGEALAASVPVYISRGTGSQTVGDGRTRGYVYSLDVNARTDADNVSQQDSGRAKFVGFTAHAAAANTSVEVVQVGRVRGFQFLFPGQTYYGSPAGGVQANPPTGVNQYEIPVGYAIDASTLYVCAGHTPRLVTTTPAYKSVLDMGYFVPPNNNTAPQRLSILSRDGSNAPFDQAFTRTMPFAGSVLSISPRNNVFYSSGGGGNNVGTATIAYVLYQNNVVVAQYTVASDANTPWLQSTFTKGSIPFAAGDQFRITAAVSNVTTGITGLKYVDLGVEFTP